MKRLSEENEEDNQQGEQRNGLSEGESQEGVADQLLGNVGVACSTVDQGSEHDAQASADASERDGGASGTNHLRGGQDAHRAVLHQRCGDGCGLVRRVEADGLRRKPEHGGDLQGWHGGQDGALLGHLQKHRMVRIGCC